MSVEGASPLIVFPDGLYTSAALLGGLDPTDPLSYTRTLDARMYLDAVRAGLRSPTDPMVARNRALHDVAITAALRSALGAHRVVAVMGGHALPRHDPGYRMAAELAATLTRKGFLVLSGGGPGAMEATHLGARLAHHPASVLDQAISTLSNLQWARFPTDAALHLIVNDQWNFDAVSVLHAWQCPAVMIARDTSAEAAMSIGIPTWLYGHEPPTPFATHHAKYFENSIREDGLLAVATGGVVFAPGGPGTVQEIFQDLAQNAYRSVGVFSPMVLLDVDGYWTVRHPVKALIDALLTDADEALTHYVSSADDAVRVIEQFGSAEPLA